MAKLLLRLGPEDAEKYPDGDKWFEWDKTTLLNLPASELAAYEDAMGGYTIGQLIIGIAQQSTLAMRAVFFLARRQGGVQEKWQHFNPCVWTAVFKLADDETEHRVDAELLVDAAEDTALPFSQGPDSP